MVKDEVLALLRASTDAVSGEQMSRRLGVSRAAVWKAVDQLRAEGYEIDAATNRGYRLSSEPDRLSEGRIAQLLDGHAWQTRMIVLERVDSTNNYAKNLAAAGAPEGTCVMAEEQSGGRGRRGRGFVSDSGGLYFSCILRPKAQPQQLMHLTALAAVAVCAAIEKASGLKAQIKWPNDPVLNGKKVCGILTELSVVAEVNETEYAVIGIGVNCNQPSFPPELSQIATSLCQEGGETIDRNVLAAELVRALCHMSQTMFSEKDTWLSRFAARCITIGRDVVLKRESGDVSAKAVGLGEDAALIVQFADGRQEEVTSGEVSVRGMYGYV